VLLRLFKSDIFSEVTTNSESMSLPTMVFVFKCFYLFSFSYYANQKKTLEINPRHPLIKNLLEKVEVSDLLLRHPAGSV